MLSLATNPTILDCVHVRHLNPMCWFRLLETSARRPSDALLSLGLFLRFATCQYVLSILSYVKGDFMVSIQKMSLTLGEAKYT